MITAKLWQGQGESGRSVHCWWGRNGVSLWRAAEHFPRKLNMWPQGTQQRCSWTHVPEKWNVCSHKTVHSSFICSSKYWTQPKWLPLGRYTGEIRIPHTPQSTQQSKWINYGYTQQLQSTSTEECQCQSSFIYITSHQTEHFGNEEQVVTARDKVVGGEVRTGRFSEETA